MRDPNHIKLILDKQNKLVKEYIYSRFYSIFLILVIISLFFLASTILVNKVVADDLYSIENTLKYEDEFGYLYILGEITNQSIEPLTNITLTANFFDSNGNLLGQYYRNPDVSVLNPSERSPFEIVYLDQSTNHLVSNYTIEVEYEVGDGKPSQLLIESVNSRFDISGFFYINGKIRNDGTENANNVTVVGTFYDKNGDVIGITKAITEPFVIPPKESSAFGLALTSKSQTPKVKDFSIKAYSGEYLSQTITTKK